MDRQQISDTLWADGYARLGSLLSVGECRSLRALYADDSVFRKHIDMARHRFGEGSYKYLAYPLPEKIAELREALYETLAPIADDWMEALGFDVKYPPTLETFLARCRTHGQTRPTPLILRYEEGGYNCLHQDLYGEIVFPFQIVVALSDPAKDYDGGELLLVEQRPRAQSIGHALTLEQGEAVVITTRYRPVKGTRGYYRANLRHGVSRITRGERYTLGIIFHDAA
ncbi:MAG TPA: 2OG-Fe(II) oxygenase [Rhizomicrobium sp.]|nr:2OG-Fe(II) oxygenase [Rhizomicrobium sp.]